MRSLRTEDSCPASVGTQAALKRQSELSMVHVATR